ncbi:hypothetical protein AKUH3B209X_11670 [Apilactobacillus kunkeei]|uniref:DUF3173 family protein n=1 Tax=Apilactobacillus kunkeei TaxID=148814 RepID=UPI0006C37AC3|nr:DUF3173 family protein [Apilactobacillus kunkeei]MCT6809272.1 DUF3173 domain-containing protein [Staphylococcus epidermidis]MCT6858822.1 DUF3173 domain-containing protein [Apilactobacillus sp.]KOY73698.1 uncharacterized protein RZ70_03130 [Apilactobacillus kunkeei]CAI2629888.1 hypothetical protein AKUH3B207X_11140 [Apilactobacillus kunkeei]CAI2632804.1 hypothetical protein AKUH4B203M_11190 [Apilactobacillus kunkeei]
MNKLVDKNFLIDLGYPEHTAKNIIAEAKKVMVNNGFEYYNNRKLGLVPADAVKSILGFNLFSKERVGE